MRAVLPGRPQAKLQALCTACWEGSRVIAYISGNALVILAGADELLQTIYHDDAEELQAVAIDEGSGRLAVASTGRLHVYCPFGKEEGVLRWSLSGSIQTSASSVDTITISWGYAGELLLGQSSLTLYSITDGSPKEIWSRDLANAARFAQFSYDGELIASCGHYDRMMKIWRRLSSGTDNTEFDFTYAPHPATVTGMHWRRPFHREQTVPNILYTICSDNKVRIWAGFNPQALQTLQLWAELDLASSAQLKDPDLVSPKTAVFFIDSRELTLAIEKAVEQGTTNEKDRQTQERLIEVASRNPEICVAVNAQGRMSAWGIDNIGSKEQKPENVYTIAEVQGLHFSFPHDPPPSLDYVQFLNFCQDKVGNAFTILAHFYDGRIEWLEGRIDQFLDPLPRSSRLQFRALWSGHSGAIKKIVRNISGRAVVSRTDDNEVLVWKKGTVGAAALSRASSFTTPEHIHRFCFIGEGDFLIVQHHKKICLWDTRCFQATEIASCDFSMNGKPLCLILIPQATVDKTIAHVATIGSDMKGIAWEIDVTAARDAGAVRREERSVMRQFCTFDLGLKDDLAFVLPVDPAGSENTISGFLDPFARDVVLAYTNTGILRTWTARLDASKGNVEWLLTSTVETGIENPTLASGSSIHKTALIDSSKTGLTIWDTRDAQLEFEQRFTEHESIQDLDWTSTPDSQSILALGFPHRVLLLSQLRYDYFSVKPAWTPIREIRVRDLSPHPIGDSCWLSDGNVVIGCGNQLFVHDRTIEAGDNLADRYTLSNRRQAPTDMFDVVSLLNGPLPVFHPQFLAQCILAGKVYMVRRVILSLHKALKFFVDGDTLDSFLDIPLTDFFAEEEVTRGTLRRKETQLLHGSFTDGVDGYGEVDPEDVTEEVATALCERLAKTTIPYLSSREQIHLADIIECAANVSKHSRSLDDGAARFLFFYRQHLLRRNQDPCEPACISWREIVCAFHSESQDILVDQISRQYNGKVCWEQARESGMFAWLTDSAALRRQMEVVARNEYTTSESHNPVDCSLYYLALHKKSVLQGLWRMATWHHEQSNTMRFLSNDFGDARWRTAALKNAYALLGKHRYRYAAGFFLLAGNVKDAVNVCATQLHDLHLAIAIARTYDESDDTGVLRWLLVERVLPLAATSGNRWLASWAFWMLKRRDLAVRTLISPIESLLGLVSLDGVGTPTCSGATTPSVGMRSKSWQTNDPALVGLYKRLRASTVSTLRGASRIPPRDEGEFIVRNARLYDRMGCDVLAVDLVRNWEFLPSSPPQQQIRLLHLNDVVVPRRRPSVVVDDRRKQSTAFEEPTAASLLDAFGF